ncbi:hypothetical protein [Streptomyces goshikiensis]|uniref:hypothetical protein n=1 Tax=Streptomyces goshikiensis TaxID=1942 RepID=UPI0036C58FAB
MRPASPGQPTAFSHGTAARAAAPAPIGLCSTGGPYFESGQRHHDVPGGPTPYGSAIRANIVNNEV